MAVSESEMESSMTTPAGLTEDAFGMVEQEDWSSDAVSFAAYQAEMAAQYAGTLAQWHDHLWRQIAQLQRKVDELQSWKTKTIDEMSKLRFEHKVLRRQYPDLKDEEPALPSKTKSSPLLLADRIEAPDALYKRSKDKKVTWGSAASSGMRAPPGLENQASPSNRSVKSTTSETLPLSTSLMSMGSTVMDEGVFEGMSVSESSAKQEFDCGGEQRWAFSYIAEWRIGNFAHKMKSCMGRPLVSPPFSANGLENLRLMVFPDGKEPAQGPRSRRQKEAYVKMATEGPFCAGLKLKVPDCPPPHIVPYFLHVGAMRTGFFEHNFGEKSVNGHMEVFSGTSWLDHIEADQSLVVRAEILKLD